MNTLATNIVALVVFPSLVVTGFLYVFHRVLDDLLDNRTIGGGWTALLTIGIGVYFLGHPLYPAVVPLINASTRWMFAIGGVYLTLGSIPFGFARYERFCTVGAWLVAIPAIAVGVLAGNGFEFGPVIRFFEPESYDIGHSFYLSIPLAFMFSFGHDFRLERRGRFVSALLLVFLTYALALGNSFPVTERVRGPFAVVFVAFGCIGVLLGIPLYVLGNALGSSGDDR